MKAKLSNVVIPDFSSKIKFDIKGKGDYRMPEDLVELMKTSDVTNITSRVKTLASRMFEEMTPDLISNIQNGVQKGIEGIKSGLPEMERNVQDLQKGYDGLTSAVKGMKDGAEQLEKAIGQMNSDITEQKAALTDLQKQREELLAKISETEGKQHQMLEAIGAIKKAQLDIGDTAEKMTALKEAVPKGFEESKNNYLNEIDRLSPQIQSTFQKTLNVGFKQVYLTAVIASIIALLTLTLYRRRPVG
jgi:SMC interacting uncharacterized protein involved in chromosome segregation